MILRVPSYYKKFRCTADRCPDTCCKGWEIDIDEETLAYYKTLQGPVAEKIRDSVREGSFALDEKGRCPLLNEKGLCEICLAFGEEALSEVCMEYPRFTMEYPGVREKTLCLSCEEAARLMFSEKQQMSFHEQHLAGEYGEDWEPEEVLLAQRLEEVRSNALLLLWDRKHPITERIASYLIYCRNMQTELFRTEPCRERKDIQSPYRAFLCRLREYEELETIGEEWNRVKAQLLEFYSEENYESAHAAFLHAQKHREYEYEHLMAYYTFRYFMRAFYDNNLLDKAQFAVASFLMVLDIDAMNYFANGENFGLSDRIASAKIYAKEVEHSEENIELLGESFLFEDAFSVEGLLAQLSPYREGNAL